jgi:mannose-6-phosphate isomerase-like protein (cupin superfamily)
MIVMRLLRSLLVALGLIAITPGATGEANAPPAKTSPLLTRALPDIASAAHRHNANTFVYVLEGSVVMQVKGGEEVTLKPGDTFYESPSDIHSVSRNASSTAPAKFLVFFIKDAGAASLVRVE